jgi:beta-hydroxylase
MFSIMEPGKQHLAVFTPFIREGMDNHKAWEKRFYKEAEALRNR